MDNNGISECDVCLCELQPKVYIKFKRRENMIQIIKMNVCKKTKFTIDSSLEKFEESKDKPCEFYEETILSERISEETKVEIESVTNYTNRSKINSSDKTLIPLITYFLADHRRETYNKLIKEIPLKKSETMKCYTDRLEKMKLSNKLLIETKQ